ncbi:Protein tyrosine and serine/threonine kinase [Pelomyxa schiedti]|nr:Protein tyrosine and serine/threonine kinase [Pelomyxa schiedti]
MPVIDIEDIRDVQRLKGLIKMERRVRVYQATLQSKGTSLDSSIRTCLSMLRSDTKCNSGAIRLLDLVDRGNFPFYCSEGFTDDFLRTENSLVKCVDGKRMLNSGTSLPYQLDCMCGTVILGITEPGRPWFSHRGSFVTNNGDSSLDLDVVTNTGCKIRGVCLKEKFLSILLVPIFVETRAIGLIHLADYEPNKFTPEVIDLVELVANSIGGILKNTAIYTKMKQTLTQLTASQTLSVMSNTAPETLSSAMSATSPCTSSSSIVGQIPEGRKDRTGCQCCSIDCGGANPNLIVHQVPPAHLHTQETGSLSTLPLPPSGKTDLTGSIVPNNSTPTETEVVSKEALSEYGLESYIDLLSHNQVTVRDMQQLPKDRFEKLGLSPLSLEKLLLARSKVSFKKLMINGVMTSNVLGQGAFGVVYRGNWEGTTPVAVKQVFQVTNMPDLLSEASLLSQLCHPNIIQFYGLSMVDAHLSLVTELADGCLLNYLRTEEQQFTTLLDFSIDISCGMAYLHRNSILHRDLAARNILFCMSGSKGMQLKIADFGLSVKVLSPGNNNTMRNASVPWASIETLQHCITTKKSDVWSFGVLLWEMYSGGKSPYKPMRAAEIISEIERGYRLPQPPNTPEFMYQLMLKCWDQEQQVRPDFDTITSILNQNLAQPPTNVGTTPMHHNHQTNSTSATTSSAESHSSDTTSSTATTTNESHATPTANTPPCEATTASTASGGISSENDEEDDSSFFSNFTSLPHKRPPPLSNPTLPPITTAGPQLNPQSTAGTTSTKKSRTSSPTPNSAL